MKVLLINGSPTQFGCTYTALKEVADTLEENGVATEIYYLGREPIQCCINCNSCKRTGRCIVDDEVNLLLDRIEEFDGIVLGSPVYMASSAGQLDVFLNRLFFAANDKMHGKVGAAVVNCRRGGASAAFDRLNKYFTVNNMPVVSSQYWNQTHGFTPEEVKRDLEGLQTLRTLARNMAWLIKCINAGKAAGIEYPVLPEQRVMTNFID